MNQDFLEWMLLLGRWLHITVAIAWIGTSFFFMWLDRTIAQEGELWMVHGGGFYQVKKLMMGPTKVPDHLHWFKWESYWTWFSGLFLIVMIFYAGGGAFLLDSSVSTITYWQAVSLSLISLVGSWLFYDFLWERKLTKDQPLVGHLLTMLWFAGMAFLLCHTLSGRAAYIHIGGMLGTWMTANVFLRIIPRQVKMVEASRRGEAVNQDWGKNAKNRSTHNTYFTLPVIFIMLSNHFPSTYGHPLNWLILLAMSAAGAAIREYFVTRIGNPTRAKSFLAVGVSLIAGVVIFARENGTVPETLAPALAAPGVSVSSVTGPTGNIRGTVKFEGPVPAGEKLNLPFACRNQHKGDAFTNEVIVSDGHLKNVVVRIVKGLEGRTFGGIPQETVKLDQIDCFYEPRVVVARVGQKVEFINSDTVFHNVRSIAHVNENFNEGMPHQNDHLIRIFDKPEFFVQTKCSVHPWMSAVVAVVDHPYYAVSGAAGEFFIHDLPVGHYTLEAWHEVFGTQSKDVDVHDGDSLDLEFTFRKQKDL